ncbi:sensor histidine kinase [Pelagerythrobacter aerophilus]|uniref:sensor histidine kinase n=1 Tax=Pelagerythrobacter aerophilus TaxID=2306995 RepID=UPI001604557A|nr:HWE histidine kinase domain-containing protein [Pelagerythrobacter aerophilus]
MEPADLGADRTIESLKCRSSRPPDYRLEAELLALLASALADRPECMPQELCDLLVGSDLAHSAGVSVVAEGDGAREFREIALAGTWRRMRGAPSLDTQSCDRAIVQNRPLLLEQPGPYYSEGEDGAWVHQALLIPFHHDAQPVGIVWLLSHDERRAFDNEDLRLMGSLSRFASAAHRLDAISREERQHSFAQAARQSMERQRVLVAELQHRVRNMLSIVRYVFSRTVDTSANIEEASMHFKGRLDALARTQVIVAQSPSGLVDLEVMIRDELLGVGQGDGATLIIDGPPVQIDTVAAENIGLAIHELTMNAIKFGALRVPGATLDIRWSVEMDKRARPILKLSWIETGVPIVPVVGQRDGFGKELIEKALPYRLGAETRLDIHGGGVRCFISTPIETRGTAAAMEAPDA